MKIRKLTIHNFRGIRDAQLALSDYGLLVGPNNAGKSTVIDAIRAFYEKDGFKFNPKKDFPFITVADNESWVEIEYELTPEEFDSLADQYKVAKNKLTIRKFFRSAEGKQRDGLAFGYTTDGILSTDQFYGAKSVQAGKLGDIVYIPAVSKVDEHAKLSGPSALRDLITSVLEDVVDSSPAFIQFKESFDKFASNVKSETTSDHRSLSGVESEINQHLKDWGTEFRLNLEAPSTAEIVKSLVHFDFVDKTHKQPQDVDQFGSGFQRSFIFSLIQVGARYAGKKQHKKTKDFTPSMTLILFEEPEAFLHPPQQDVLARDLRAIATSQDRQVLCSTHSPNFVSRNADAIPSIIRMTRDDAIVSAYQISSERWGQIVDANQAINPIVQKYPKLKKKLSEDDLRPEMEAVKHFLWLNPDRCGIFFAEHVLLVEGPTEVALLNRMIADGHFPNCTRGLYILDCIGKWNIHRFMNLLAALGIPHAVLHDDDHGDVGAAEFNALIADTRDPATTCQIQTIRGDLERLLGVPPTVAHRKPQHVLYLYTSNQIKPEMLAALCALVTSCVMSPLKKTTEAKDIPPAVSAAQEEVVKAEHGARQPASF